MYSKSSAGSQPIFDSRSVPPARRRKPEVELLVATKSFTGSVIEPPSRPVYTPKMGSSPKKKVKPIGKSDLSMGVGLNHLNDVVQEAGQCNGGYEKPAGSVA